MSDNKPTPGPWVWDAQYGLLDGGDHSTVLWVDTEEDAPLPADATLIAAAPDLLAACENAASEIDAMTSEWEKDARMASCDHQELRDMLLLLEDLTAAIKKAKGE